LHDSLGQTLTGLGMLSSGLHRRLAGTDPASADTARQIARQAQVALEDVRRVSRGLMPLEIDPDSFVPALRELAGTTATVHGVRVELEDDLGRPLRDGRTVTQLYRIAQEAVTNAVKHGRPRVIRIRVATSAGRLTLSVRDDGIGIEHRAGAAGTGLGLRIMNHRAASIGATLSVAPGADGGTEVACALRDVPALAAAGSA
jgi:signal transduction histidine kinase